MESKITFLVISRIKNLLLCRTFLFLLIFSSFVLFPENSFVSKGFDPNNPIFFRLFYVILSLKQITPELNFITLSNIDEIETFR